MTTQFIRLEKSTKGIAELTLYEVRENKSQWLVRYINKRMTTKWFLSYETAKAYYDRKRNTYKMK